MALSVVHHPTNNLRIHYNFFNKSYITTSSSSVKLHSSSASAARLCSGLRTSFGLASPPPCSNLRSIRQYRRYSKVSLSDDDTADDDFYTFEKFTEKAINVVTLAKDEAKRYGYDLFGSEHVLLAIISEGTSVAADFLNESMRIENVDEAREAVKTITVRGSRFDANRVFKLSIENARKLGDDYVDVEHILLGLIPEDESNGTVVLDILQLFGVDPASTRKQLLQRMDAQKMVMLEKYGTNLRKVAKNGAEAGPVIEITETVAEEVIDTLSTPPSMNACLIGKSKVANTEIVRTLSKRIACGKAPEEISGKQVITLHMERLVDAPEEHLKQLIKEIKAQSGGIILFVDDIQSLITTIGEVTFKDLSESGELQCISTASTKEEYEKNKFVMTQFLPVAVPKASITEAVFILRNFVSGQIRIADEALLASVYLSHKYSDTDSFLDHAFDLIDAANSVVEKYKSHRQDVSEADIRNIVSLSNRVRVEDIAATKDIVADTILGCDLGSNTFGEKSILLYYTKRFRDRLTDWYNPTDFFEGKCKSLIDSKVLSDLLDIIENEIVNKGIKRLSIAVVDFDAAANSPTVHQLMF